MKTKAICFAAGCFWGAQKYFSLINGVESTEVGYANGCIANPSYEQVKTGRTGHAETVKVCYLPSVISLDALIRAYFRIIDPTTAYRQGGDVGQQYRAGIYYTDDEDIPVVESALKELSGTVASPVVVEARYLGLYYRAEEYHQNYLKKNPDGYCHIGGCSFDYAREYNK